MKYPLAALTVNADENKSWVFHNLSRVIGITIKKQIIYT